MIKNKGYHFSKSKFQIQNFKFRVSNFKGKKKIFFKGLKSIKVFFLKRENSKKKKKKGERGRSYISKQWNNKALII